MITIYHNNRCSKSRQGLKILQESNHDFKIVEYLKQPLTKSELSNLIETLGITPIELVRKTESIWKINYRGKSLTDNEIIEAMITHPKLMERPIVKNNNKAVIGRPPETILNII